MESRILVLWAVLSAVQVTAAFQWNSAISLPNGTTIPACPGQDVTLPWKYSANADEHLTNVEWHFKQPGGNEAPVATQVLGSFVAIPSNSLHVQFIPNAGIRLQNVATENTGTYSVHVNLNVHGSADTKIQTVELQVSENPLTTDGQLHVTMLPDAVFDNSTQQYHVQLSCGNFRSVWGSRTSVVWKTPSGQTLTSTSNENGRFLLSVPNPVTSGEYTCLIDDTSPASICVQSGSPLQRGATIVVDGTEARFAVMEARMSALQAENVNLKQELQQEKQSNEDLRHDLQNLTRQMTQGDENLKQDLQTLTHQTTHDLQALTHQTAQEDDNLKHLISTNTQLVNSKSADLASKLQRAVHQVFFHVRLSSHTGTNNPIIFNGVHSNVGGGYSTSTGYFTAPVSGTYLFMFSVQRAGINSDDRTYMALFVNEIRMGYAHGESYATGSNHAVVHLSAGERAWITGPISELGTGDLSTFSGVLIQADI